MKVNNHGFSLTEVLLGAGLIGVMAMGVISFQASQLQMSNREKVAGQLSAMKARLLQTVTSDAAWSKTVAMSSSSSNLRCIGSNAGCTGLAGPFDFDLLEADGSVVYSSSPTSGFNLNGRACAVQSGTTCPILLRVQWKPLCASGDVNCRYPLIQISGTYSSAATGTLNLAKYSFSLNRSPIQNTLCPTAAPACPGAMAVCTTNGWNCLPPNSPYCRGAVSWNDATTAYGPCSTTVASPGVLHDTTATETNTASGKTGSASFLCIPGQPDNGDGLIQQAGATCAAAALVCPAGTSTLGLGGPAVPAGCLCANAGDSWNGSSCGPTSGTWFCAGSILPVANSSCTHDPLALGSGTSCSNPGEVCSAQVTTTTVTNTMSLTLGTYANCGCVVPAGANGATIQPYLGCGSAGSYSAVPTTPFIFNNATCTSGLVHCANTSIGQCVAPLANGQSLSLPVFSAVVNCNNGYAQIPGCQSGLGQCNAFGTQATCTNPLSPGTTISNTNCGGSWYFPVGGAAFAEPACSSGQVTCTAIGQETCQ